MVRDCVSAAVCAEENPRCFAHEVRMSPREGDHGYIGIIRIGTASIYSVPKGDLNLPKGKNWYFEYFSN